jgi:hypothetical protein
MRVAVSKTLVFAVVLGLLLSLEAGCREKKPETEIIQLEGKVEKVIPHPDGTGEIVVRYYSKKHKQEVEGTGLVTAETEILVNGQPAKLSDLKPGETVSGEVRIERGSKGKRLVALKIHVDRAEPMGG